MVPSLATRATLAAWSLNNNNTGNQVNTSTSGNASHTQANGQGRDVSTIIFLLGKKLHVRSIAACSNLHFFVKFTKVAKMVLSTL